MSNNKEIAIESAKLLAEFILYGAGLLTVNTSIDELYKKDILRGISLLLAGGTTVIASAVIMPNAANSLFKSIDGNKEKRKEMKKHKAINKSNI